MQARQGDIELTVEVVEKAEPRTFEKYGKQGRVCNAKIKDATGTVSLTLWNDEIDKIGVGDKIKISKGYVGEWQGELQVSTGKFGSIEVLEKGKAPPAEEKKDDVKPEPQEELDIEEEQF